MGHIGIFLHHIKMNLFIPGYVVWLEPMDCLLGTL